MTSIANAPFLNLFDPGFTFEGADIMRAQQEHWYANSPIGPVALRYREVADLLGDPRFRLGGEAYMALHQISEGPLFDWWMRTLMSVPVATHQRLRGLLAKAFTPKRVEDLRGFVRATARSLAAAIEPGEQVEFVAEFADPLPALVMCELLGVPAEDYPLFHHWAADIGLAFASSGITAEARATVERAIELLGEYVDQLIHQRRRAPQDDLISAIIAAEAGHGLLSAAEVRDLVLLLVWAGQDTTARQLGRALVAFSDHPEQWIRLGDQPALLTGAVGEVLRWTPQARMIQRFANMDLRYGGMEFAKDSVVFVCVAAANRDERMFAEPARFDIGRSQPVRQLAFGGGIHYCLGHALARLELDESLAALTERFGPPAVTGPAVWRPVLAMIHGPDRLPLTFAPRATVG